MALPPMPVDSLRATDDPFAVDIGAPEEGVRTGADPAYMRRKEEMFGEATRLRAEARALDQAMSAVARSGLPVAGPVHPLTGKAWEYAGLGLRELRDMRDEREAEAGQTWREAGALAPAVWEEDEYSPTGLVLTQGKGKSRIGRSVEGQDSKGKAEKAAAEEQRKKESIRQGANDVNRKDQSDSQSARSQRSTDKLRPYDESPKVYPGLYGLLHTTLVGVEGKSGRVGYLATEKGSRIFLQECVEAARGLIREEFGEAAAESVRARFRNDRDPVNRGALEIKDSLLGKDFWFDASLRALGLIFYFQTVDTNAAGAPDRREQAILDDAVKRVGQKHVAWLEKLRAPDTKNPTEESIADYREAARKVCREVFREALPELRAAYIEQQGR